MSMDPFDYDPQWREKLKDNEDEWVDGFAVPYRFRFLLPMINLVHYSTLWTKYRIQHYGAMIPRKVFLFYPNHLREDYTHEALYLDDEEQDTYTRQIQKEDIVNNESYAKVFSFLVITPFPSYFIRLYHRVTFIDALSMISMLISAWSIPAVRTDSLAVVLPGQWKLFFMRLNIYIAAVITLHVIFAPPGRVTWDMNGAEILWLDDVKHFGMLPLLMALMSHCVRRFMEAVSMVEMEHIRYSYLPHSRGGIMDVPELPQDPPGPPPELPPSPERRVLPPAPAPPETPAPAPAAAAAAAATAAQPAQPARPPARPPAQATGQWASPWTIDQYGFDFDQWVTATFTPPERRQEIRTTPLDIRTLQGIPEPPEAPPLPMSRRVRSIYYLNCYRWQRDQWPDLLYQRALIQSQPLYPDELQNQEATTLFLTTWARFQTEEWEDFQRRRGQSRAPEIPAPPPQLARNPNPDTNFAYYMACVNWQREHRANLQRQRTHILAPGEPQTVPDRRRNRELLSAWVVWQRDTREDLQRHVIYLMENGPIIPPTPQDPPASRGPPTPPMPSRDPPAPPGGPPASQRPPAPPAPPGGPPASQRPPAPPAPLGGPPASQRPPVPPAPPRGPPASQRPPVPPAPPGGPPAPQRPPVPPAPPGGPPASQRPPVPPAPPGGPPASQRPPVPPAPPGGPPAPQGPPVPPGGPPPSQRPPVPPAPQGGPPAPRRPPVPPVPPGGPPASQRPPVPPVPPGGPPPSQRPPVPPAPQGGPPAPRRPPVPPALPKDPPTSQRPPAPPIPPRDPPASQRPLAPPVPPGGPSTSQDPPAPPMPPKDTPASQGPAPPIPPTDPPRAEGPPLS